MKVTILGCGSSAGTPLIACKCSVCTSANPKNTRLRPSIYIEVGGKSILIDTSPDLRQQALTNKLSKLDAVLYTHDHADHTHGIDELRSFNFINDKEIPIYGSKAVIEALELKFPYCFGAKNQNWYRPALVSNVISGSFKIGDIEVTPLLLKHGRAQVFGFRIGDFAYTTDANLIPDETMALLAGIKVWVVDCLQMDAAPTHAHLALTLSWIEKIKPAEAFLTHMSHSLDFDALSKNLPVGAMPAFDGQVITL